jgi:hypothetical protein
MICPRCGRGSANHAPPRNLLSRTPASFQLEPPSVLSYARRRAGPACHRAPEASAVTTISRPSPPTTRQHHHHCQWCPTHARAWYPGGQHDAPAWIPLAQTLLGMAEVYARLFACHLSIVAAVCDLCDAKGEHGPNLTPQSLESDPHPG